MKVSSPGPHSSLPASLKVLLKHCSLGESISAHAI
jgi:hypothetical protein